MISTEVRRARVDSVRETEPATKLSVSVPAPPRMVSAVVNCEVCPSNRSLPAVPVSLSALLLSRPTGARLCWLASACSVEP